MCTYTQRYLCYLRLAPTIVGACDHEHQAIDFDTGEVRCSHTTFHVTDEAGFIIDVNRQLHEFRSVED